MFTVATRTVLSSALIVALAQAVETPIMLKDGKTVTGVIQGKVALYGEVGYVLVQGEDIIRVDKGVARLKARARGTACLVERSVPAVEVLEEMAADSTARSIEGMGLRLTMFNNKGTAIVPLGKAEVSGDVLGEFRVVAGKGQLKRTLTVMTARGPVEVKLE